MVAACFGWNRVCTNSVVMHRMPRWCASGAGVAALKPHPCFLGVERVGGFDLDSRETGFYFG